MLSSEDAELVRVASELIASREGTETHTVAAAARTAGGNVYTALNVSHFTGGPCAELVVLGHAAAQPEPSRLARIVAAGDGQRGVIPPCGRCRQIMFDTVPDIRIVIPVGAELEALPIAQLLPYPYVWHRH